MDGTADRMALYVEQLQASAAQAARALAPVLQDACRGIEASGRALQEAPAASAARWRVHTKMPTLTLTHVLTGGYVAYREA